MKCQIKTCDEVRVEGWSVCKSHSEDKVANHDKLLMIEYIQLKDEEEKKMTTWTKLCDVLSCRKPCEKSDHSICKSCESVWWWFCPSKYVEDWIREQNEAYEAKQQETKPTPIKHDAGKPRLSLVRPEFLRGLAECLTYGAQKYSDHNYAKGFDWSRIYDALQRHLTSWLAGEDNDPESGLSHLDHAAASLMMLRYHVSAQVGKDDRLKKVA